eukprot:9216502-Pyramimonas_sp.AAC.1
MRTPGPSLRPIRRQLAAAAEIGPLTRGQSLLDGSAKKAASEANVSLATESRGTHEDHITRASVRMGPAARA